MEQLPTQADDMLQAHNNHKCAMSFEIDQKLYNYCGLHQAMNRRYGTLTLRGNHKKVTGKA